MLGLQGWITIPCCLLLFLLFLFFLLSLSLSEMKAFVALGYTDTLPAFLFLPVSFHKLGKRSYLRKLGGDNLEIV